MELQDMSVKQLNEVAAKASELALSKRDSAKEELYQNVLALVLSEGFSLDEIVELHKVKAGKPAKSSKTGVKIAPKYRDSDGNVWTGRGKKPKWVVAAEEAGVSLETFLIVAPAATEVEPETPVAADEAPAVSLHRPSFGHAQTLPESEED